MADILSRINMRKNQEQLEEPKNNRFLQTFLVFDWYFSLALILLMVCFFFFKLYAMPYPSGQWSMEIIILILFAFLQQGRISIGSRAN